MNVEMRVSMIAAIGRKGELGEGNQLIWNIPSDLKRFREMTSHHPVIMGRKTHESIGRLLPNRPNIIVTRDPNYNIPGAVVAHSIEEALDNAKTQPGSDEVFIIGGGQIYKQGIPHADRLYLTKIDATNPNADAFFPDYSEFRHVIARESLEENGVKFEYIDLER